MQEERRGRVGCPQLGTSQCTSVNCFCGREPPAYKVLVKRLYLADQMVQFVWHRHLGISAEFCIRTTVLIIQCLAVLILFVCSDQPLSYSWRSCSRIVCAFMQLASCSWFLFSLPPGYFLGLHSSCWGAVRCYGKQTRSVWAWDAESLSPKLILSSEYIYF